MKKQKIRINWLSETKWLSLISSKKSFGKDDEKDSFSL